MERRFARRLALLLIAAAGALVIAVVVDPSRSRSRGRTSSEGIAHVDAPLGFICCDDLPIKTPEPEEAAQDERTRPYFLRVRTLSFPKLEPVDVELDGLVVRGAANGKRVGTGEYLFDGFSLGYTAVTLFAPKDPTMQRTFGPSARPKVLGERNPVPLARHAVTTCDIVVTGADEPKLEIELHGVVLDRSTQKPIAGARVACGNQAVVSDEQGRFEFRRAVAWTELMRQTAVTCAGFRPYAVVERSMASSWIRSVLDRHEARFWLRSTSPVAAASRIPDLAR